MADSSTEPQQAWSIVDHGVPTSIIIVPDDATEADLLAAEQLSYHVKRASGAAISIAREGEGQALDAFATIILIGETQQTRTLGYRRDELSAETYVVKTEGKLLVLLGHDHPLEAQWDLPGSWGTVWAVAHVLDHHLGVRWLWPGEVGTYVPERSSIVLPEMDVNTRPALEQRRLRFLFHLQTRDSKGGHMDASELLLPPDQQSQLRAEADMWGVLHRLGSRSEYQFGHAFMNWWNRYSREHREVFATLIDNVHQPYPTDRRVKLCVSNPKVDDLIIAEWQAAGMPNNWPIAPNDGSGFCVCADCRSIDVPPNPSVKAVWNRDVSLTGRYVHFWNRLLPKMRELNPQVTLSTYAYSAYREPPQTRLTDGFILGIVHVYNEDARSAWHGWSDANAELLLRPNWWHVGAVAPHIPLRRAGGYFQFARDNNMIGFDFDSLMGYWGTQGPNYYLIARLAARPDLAVEDVIDEYVSAFGKAGPAISDYLDYWEQFTEAAAYAGNAGGVVSQDPEGLYETLLRERDLRIHPIVGSWLVIPLLYTDEVLDEAFAILNRADELAEQDNHLVQARIEFLRDGLKHLRLTREVLRLGYEHTRPADATQQAYRELIDQLQSLRRELTPRHVIWGDLVNAVERRREIRTDETRSGWADTDGL